MSLSVIRIGAKVSPTASLIIVHGLGDTGEGWTFLPQILDMPHVNYVFPNAPTKPLSVAGGQMVPQWFDIFEFGNPNARQDEKGYWESVGKISTLIDEEIARGIAPERIVVGGFSQGAAVSLGVAATYHRKIGGFLILSGFFPAKNSVESKLVDFNKTTKLFHGHGTVDPMIDVDYARRTSALFKSLGFTNYNLTEYAGMAHSTNNEELLHVRSFLESIVS